MAKRVAQFEKVSFDEFKKAFEKTFSEYNSNDIKDIYEKIIIPQRATKGSAGYDFFSPIDVCLTPDETIKIPTGIRVKIDENWVLKLYPRSGLGFKFRLQLNNTVGIIDSDYYYSDNEGHIYVKITNAGNKIMHLSSGMGFVQGVFVEYGLTINDHVEKKRNGGLGKRIR